MNIENLIDKIIKALAFKYPKDRMVPGLTTAFLRSGEYYVSLVRYCPDKTVVCKSTGPTLLASLKSVAKQLVSLKHEVDPINELNNLLDTNNSSDFTPGAKPKFSKVVKPSPYDDLLDDTFPSYTDEDLDEEVNYSDPRDRC